MSLSPVVTLSGWSCPASVLTPLAKDIRESYRSLAIDDLTDCRPFTYALDLLKHLPAEPTTVIGWSMGGMIALQAASLSPDRFSRVVAINASPCFCAKDDYHAGVPEKALRAMIQQLQTQPTQVIENFHSCIPEHSREQTVAHASQLPTERLSAQLQWLLSFDIRQALSDITCPVDLFCNPEDAIVPPDASTYLNQHLPHSTLHTLNKVGHAGWMTEIATLSRLTRSHQRDAQ